MDWITESIAIGTYLDAQDGDLLKQFGIRSVLGLVSTLAGIAPDQLGLERIEIVPLIDGPGNDRRVFLRAVDTLEELVREAAPVLVHCHAGRARAPVVVAGFLMKTLGLDADPALERVRARRDISPEPALSALLDHLG